MKPYLLSISPKRYPFEKSVSKEFTGYGISFKFDILTLESFMSWVIHWWTVSDAIYYFQTCLLYILLYTTVETARVAFLRLK